MRRALLATTLLLAGITGGVSGCAEMAAASAAATAAEVAMDTVPSAIRAVADMAVVNNNANWGKPNAVRKTKNFYVFFYPTPDSEIRRTGHPRMVVVERQSHTARLTALERGT